MKASEARWVHNNGQLDVLANREQNANRGSFPYLTIDLDLTLVIVNDFFDNCHAEACSMFLAIGHKGLKEFLLDFFRHSSPRVNELYLYKAIDRFGFDGKFSPLRHGVAGVACDVIENPERLVLV